MLDDDANDNHSSSGGKEEIADLQATLQRIAAWLQPFQVSHDGRFVEFHNARGTGFFLGVAPGASSSSYQLFVSPPDAYPSWLGATSTPAGLVLLLGTHCR